MATLAAQVSATGISAPDYADIYAQLQSLYWQIYGTDADLDPDSQDGQLIAVFAQAIYDTNMLAVAVFQAYSPTYAQGAGLSSVVKINGIRRDVATASTVPVTLTGTYGTPVVGALIGDSLNLNTQWSIPNVTIGEGGTVDTTATSTADGAVTAGAGTLTEILTPIAGWQEVTNTAAATVGAPVETDAALRQRQSRSTALPAQTPLESIYANVADVVGVERLKVYENDTDVTDALGIPSHSICAVVEGGVAQDICAAIAAKKSPGTGTYGTTTVIVIDQNGVPDTIDYFVLQDVPVTVSVVVEPLAGWVTSTEALIQQAVAGWLNSLDIGVVDYLNKLWAPANLNGDVTLAAVNAYLTAQGQTPVTQPQLDALSATYNVTAITQGVTGAALVAADVPIAFNQAAQGMAASVNVAAA